MISLINNFIAGLITVITLVALPVVGYRLLRKKTLRKPTPANEILELQPEQKKEVPLKETNFEMGEELEPQLPDNWGQPWVPDLPWGYGDNRIVLMPRNPHELYAYWEISENERWNFDRRFGAYAWEQSRPVLRLYDITGIQFNGHNANQHWDVGIDDFGSNYYLKDCLADRTYCVEFGRFHPDGTYIPLLRSNPVHTPRNSVSDVIDPNWPPLHGIYNMYGLENADDSMLGLSSAELMARSVHHKKP